MMQSGIAGRRTIVGVLGSVMVWRWVFDAVGLNPNLGTALAIGGTIVRARQRSELEAANRAGQLRPIWRPRPIERIAEIATKPGEWAADALYPLGTVVLGEPEVEIVTEPSKAGQVPGQ